MKTISWRRFVLWRRTNDFSTDIDIRIFVGSTLLHLVMSTVSPTHWARVWRWDFFISTCSFYFVFTFAGGLPNVVFLETCTSGRIWMLFARMRASILFIIDMKPSWNEILTNGDSDGKSLFLSGNNTMLLTLQAGTALTVGLIGWSQQLFSHLSSMVDWLVWFSPYMYLWSLHGSCFTKGGFCLPLFGEVILGVVHACHGRSVAFVRMV